MVGNVEILNKHKVGEISCNILSPMTHLIAFFINSSVDEPLPIRCASGPGSDVPKALNFIHLHTSDAYGRKKKMHQI